MFLRKGLLDGLIRKEENLTENSAKSIHYLFIIHKKTWFESSKHHHFLGFKPRVFFGALAQLVARLNGIQKVRGSTPLCSTIKNDHPNRVVIFYAMKA